MYLGTMHWPPHLPSRGHAIMTRLRYRSHDIASTTSLYVMATDGALRQWKAHETTSVDAIIPLNDIA